MIILGIDPGTATTGFGLISVEPKNFDVINFGLIETDKDGSPGARLVDIHKQISMILTKYKPDIFAIEKLFFATNAKTAIRVGQAQGVMLYSAAEQNIHVVEYAPGTIKKEDISAKLELELDNSFDEEELLSALPSGGFKIIK